jgi:hypothetical protein
VIYRIVVRILGSWALAALCCSGPAAFAAQTVTYEKDIAPILAQSCSKCHGAGMAMSQLRLDSEAAILHGGKSGPAIVPGKSGDSLLMKRILGLTDGPRMPMGGDPLPEQEVQLLRAWIDHGDFTAVKAEASPSTPASSSTASRGGSSPLFATKVRPILAARCYGCHGADTHQNGLRLDSLNAILKGSENGKVVVPGHSADSRLIQRLEAKERPQMPYGGPPLSPDQIQLIAKWIDQGAPGPDSSDPVAASKPLKHWAYMKPVMPPVPSVSNQAWVRNPIDAFVMAKLDKEGLKPSPEADKAILLRRVYLDLIGLPPSPKEVDAFLADKSPDAYEKVVDRLLASPHYGERWARPWLDMARYADTNGYEKDNRRTAWEYRDWVIRALNSDMSFKEFTIDQLAGDMLPNPTKDQLIATGFNRNTMLNQEGGVDPEEYYWYELVDRVNTTSAVWLGSTLGCAQCHNHKFDPFMQKDYYRFLAFFSNSQYTIVGKPSEQYAQEPELELPTPEQAVKSKQLRGEIAKLQTKLDTQTPELDAAQAKWEADMRAAGNRWHVLKPQQAQSAGGAVLTILPDSSVLASGKNPMADTYTLTARTNEAKITGVRIEVLNDKSLPHNGPGRDSEGNFFLSDFDVEVAPASNPAAKQHVNWKAAKADESQSGYDIANLLKKEPGVRGWAIDSSDSDAPAVRQAVLIPDEPISAEGGAVLSITLKHQMRHASRNLGHFRISVTSAADPEFIVQIPAHLRPLLDVSPDKRTKQQKEDLAAAYREVSPLLDATRKQMQALDKAQKDLGIFTAMIMREQPGFLRPAAYIRERGSFASKGELVYADVPSALGHLPPNAMPNRLGLAEWLVSDDNPLTARVTVNRFWETIFGHGIVETTEDFGTQGDPPSNQQLLDFLAVQFMRDGWSMKKIQRLIVTSATYRQSSRVTPALLARDPYNKLYARGPRFRVEAEMVHDIALSTSGLLSPKMYGPSVFPYQPDGIWDVPYSKDKWVESSGEDRYRRAIYTFMRRSAPYPSLVTYDAPSREFCTIRRVRTNTPLQALTSLNDPLFFDAARALAKRMVNEGGDTPESRAIYGFRLVASRRPQASEIERILQFYNQQLREYRQNLQSAVKTLGTEASSDAAKAPELASWTMVANVLLNMDETISKD